MTAALVDNLGIQAPGGAHTFPTVVSMAEAGEAFYRVWLYLTRSWVEDGLPVWLPCAAERPGPVPQLVFKTSTAS